MLRPTDDTETYLSGWKNTLHLGTLDDLTLVRYDNSHEDTKGHEHHTAVGNRDDIEFPGKEDRLVEFWASASTGRLSAATRLDHADQPPSDSPIL